MDEQFVQAVSLLLQQVRFARRALEDVERHTSRYGGLAFTAAFAAGPRFGEPPMFNGALKVHVININDLAPGDGLAGMFQALLGGVGRFIGGLGGGFIGGIISGWALPDMIARIESIAATVERIVNTLGLDLSPAKEEGDGETSEQSNPEAQANTGGNLAATLDRVVAATRALTALFTAATDPSEAERIHPIDRTEQGAAWLSIIQAVERALTSLGRVIDGLTPLIVVAVGSIFLLIDKLRDIRLAILETVSFIVRNAFLLRGLVLVVVYETLASVLDLGSRLLGLLSTAVTEILTAVFDAIETLLNTAVSAIRMVGAGLAATINGVLNWLVNGLGEALRWLGSLHVFRVVTHALLILPSILPPLYALRMGDDMPTAQSDRLATAHGWGDTLQGLLAQGDPGASTSDDFTPFPDLSELLAPQTSVDALLDTVRAAGLSINANVATVFEAGQDFLSETAEMFQNQASIEARFSNGRINGLLDRLNTRASELTAAIEATQAAAARRESTGLEAIAQAYESWLTGGGLTTLLTRFQQHFASTTPGTEAGAGTAATVAPLPDPPAATVEIERMEILIEPPPAPDVVARKDHEALHRGAFRMRDEDVYFAFVRYSRELDRRGALPDDDPYDFDPAPTA